MICRLGLLASASVLSLLGTSSVAAQTAAASPGQTPLPTTTAPAASVAPAAASTPPTENAIGEIVVTANKRAENIQKVGMSITAVSGEALAQRQITSLSDIAAVVPGLTYAASTTNTPIFTLRGVGFNESSLGVYPAVSVYVDQAPLPFPVMASHSDFDLQRVEVLKGPQGTLFGQNSTGGAINYIAAKPTDHFTAGGDLSYGRFNQFSGNAYVSSPLTDTLGFRAAVTGLRADGWQYSQTRPGDHNGAQSYYAGRLLVDWKPGEIFHFTLNLNGWQDRSEPQAQQLIAKIPANPDYVKPGELAAPFAPSTPRAADWTGVEYDPYNNTNVDFSPMSNRKFYQTALTSVANISDDISLTALTTYDHFTQTQRTDNDGMAIAAYNLQGSDGYIHSFNQEVRLANSSTDRFRWIVGGNYEHSTTFENQDLRYFDNSTSNPTVLFINASGVTEKQKIRNYAFFGNGEFSITPKLTVIGGVRYTDSRIIGDICGYTPPNGNVNKFFNVLGSELGTVPFTPIGENGCYTLNQDLVPGEPFIRTLHQHNVSWRAGLNYQVTPTTLVYANVSRGYKAGSFPALAAASYRSLEPVTQESVTAYEAGFKAQLFDRRVQLNAAGFYYDYKDKQIRGKLLDSPNIFGVLDALVNVPKSRILGAEADVTVRPLEGLTLNGAITYLDSKIQRYSGYNVLGNEQNFAGAPLPFTPKWQGMVNVDYRLRTEGGTPFVGVSVNARTKSDAALGGGSIPFPADAPEASVKPGVTHPFELDAYATVDGRLGYDSGKGWQAWIWGKNIFNKYYWTQVIVASDTTARFAGMPATYGATFAIKFK